MIKYNLVCKNCTFSFDSWFASSKEYEKLKKKNFLSCNKCNSKKIQKSLMAPKLMSLVSSKKSDLSTKRFEKFEKKIKEYQNFIKNNFDFVGKNFAYEARSIHYDNKKKTKGIYGIASNNEIKELKEEGIETSTIPWIEDKKH
tara:strand:+ start:347 stop:775 length:429 start_codon:yes stop_codon:yes gene_type:complete